MSEIKPMTVDELLELKVEPESHVIGDLLVLHGPYEYEIDKKEVSTHAGIVSVIHRLTGKTWVTVDMIRDVIEFSGFRKYL